ncbi:MAG: hypothetical protein FGM40_00745, partial [Rhodocyclaceae bacterium]|nr:hypothetical protein [Rhodocyclaceae bacterium]
MASSGSNYDVTVASVVSNLATGVDSSTRSALQNVLGSDPTSVKVAAVVSPADLKALASDTRVLDVAAGGTQPQTFNFKDLPKAAQASVDLVVFNQPGDDAPVRA